MPKEPFALTWSCAQRRGTCRWLLIMGIWSIAALVSASQRFVRSNGELGWLEAVQQQLPAWWIWGLLTPLCLSLARRFPLDRENWWIRGPQHLVFGTLVVVIYIAAQSPLSIMAEGRAVTMDSYTGAVVGGLAFQYLTQLLTYVGLVAIGHAVGYQARLAEREAQSVRLEKELSDARLQSLRAQLQPHFLFNTLHTIGGLVRNGEQGGALRMLSGLSDLLRHTLDHLDAPEIPLHQELEATERYLEIEEVRFRDRLEVLREIDPQVMEARVPALILQPLLENAMRHGIEADQDSAQIVIRARRIETGELELTVQDDGVGLADGFDLDARQGVGLGLTRRRLRSLYGEEQDLQLEPVTPRGVRVVVRIPFRSQS